MEFCHLLLFYIALFYCGSFYKRCPALLRRMGNNNREGLQASDTYYVHQQKGTKRLEHRALADGRLTHAR